MKHPASLALVLLCCSTLALGATGASTSGSKTFRWVDDKGQVHYGDSVPPEYAQKGVSELNAHGVAVKEVPAQLSPQQAAEEQQHREAEGRRQQHDQFLLTTYTSVRDIEQLRDERLSQLDAQITASHGYIDSVQGRLKSLQGRALNFKPYSDNPNARRLPDALAAEIVQALNEAHTQQQTLESRQQEQRELRAAFQADIDRYRELSARKVPR